MLILLYYIYCTIIEIIGNTLTLYYTYYIYVLYLLRCRLMYRMLSHYTEITKIGTILPVLLYNVIGNINVITNTTMMYHILRSVFA